MDTGMGFERMCKVLQLKDSVYDTDLFVPAIQVISQNVYLNYDSKYYEQEDEIVKYTAKLLSNQKRFRIVADHSRTAFMLINDGLIPSNVGAGYVLRMIIRRMVYNVIPLRDLSIVEYEVFLKQLLQSYESLRTFNTEEIIRLMLEEIKLFKKTLQNGMQMLDEIFKREYEKRKNTPDVS
ncbi:hypothetical protein FACS189428_1740 [Clostridia bacterium]|nr:hypothetical protein FACS189428_1740 [Clostridia bacterium]